MPITKSCVNGRVTLGVRAHCDFKSSTGNRELNMSKFIKIIVLWVVLLPSFGYSAQYGNAYGDVGEIAAGGTGTGAVPKNLIYFTIEGTMAIGDCATSSTPHFVIDSDNGGETMVSLLLAAKMAGKKVHVNGRGTCNLIPGHEDVSLIYID